MSWHIGVFSLLRPNLLKITRLPIVINFSLNKISSSFAVLALCFIVTAGLFGYFESTVVVTNDKYFLKEKAFGVKIYLVFA